MSKTKINITNIINLGPTATSAKNVVSGVKSGIASTRNATDSLILGRNNIGISLNSAYSMAAGIESEINSVMNAINNGALKYNQTENDVLKNASTLTGTYAPQYINQPLINTGYRDWFHEAPQPKTTTYITNSDGSFVGPVDKNSMNPYAQMLLNESFEHGAHDLEKFMTAADWWDCGLSLKAVLGKNGKISLSATTDYINYADFQKSLNKYASSAELAKYDMKTLKKNGISGDTFDDFMKGVAKPEDDIMGIRNYVDNVADPLYKPGMANAAKQSLKNDLIPTNRYGFSGKTTMGKVSTGLGIVGDVATVGFDFRDNFYNEKTGSWDFNDWGSKAAYTATDVAWDIGSSAGSTAAGAAIGSCFAPPIGTVVGAAAGFTIDVAINWDIADINGDGKKDSLVDMAKIETHKLIDTVTSWF